MLLQRPACCTHTHTHRCDCILDGQTGRTCEVPTEQFCLNQCSMHGDCLLGYCQCHAGWYGTDCSRRVAGSREAAAGGQQVQGNGRA